MLLFWFKKNSNMLWSQHAIKAYIIIVELINLVRPIRIIHIMLYIIIHFETLISFFEGCILRLIRMGESVG